MDTESGKPSAGEAKEVVAVENWTLATDPKEIIETEAKFAEYMAAKGWDKDTVDSMVVGLDEALKNALYHGNLEVGEVKSQEERNERARTKQAQSEYKDRKINVKISIWPDKVEALIADEGSGFDWRKMMAKNIEAGLLDDTGRGLLIMRAYFDEIKYNEAGNEITLIKYKPA